MAVEAISIALIAAFAGYLAGIFTGVLPGLHINLVANIVASLAGIGLPGSFAVAAFLLAMSVSHVFHEFIPSVFIGVSDSDSALSIMPGHRMLLKGEGIKAATIAALGGLAGVVALVLASPLLLLIIKPIFSATKSSIGLILIAVIAIHFLKKRTPKDAAVNALVLLLSGSFGIAVFSLPGLNEPLLPMFSGLFGLSSLAGSLLKQPMFPQQKQNAAIKIAGPARIARLLSVGLLSSSLMGLFPALGPAQAAMLGTAAFRKIKAASYMFLLGVIASASMLFSLLTLYSFGKARNGSISVLGNIFSLDAGSTAALLAIAAATAAVSCLSVMLISRLFLKLLRKANYALLCWAIIIFLVLFVLIISGPLGTAVLAVATAIGIIPILTKTSRQLLMGCLMVPVIGYYL